MRIDDFLEIGRIRNRSYRFKKKLDDTIKLCQEQIKTHENPYIAVSGGKDSNAMAYVVADAAARESRDISLWAHVSDASFPQTKETIKSVSDGINKFFGINTVVDFSECEFSAIENMGNFKEKRQFGKSGVFYSEVRKYAKDKDVSFVGVRAFESKRRMKAANIHGNTFHSKSMGDIDVCYPLLWWKLEDIAAAIVHYNIPIHPIYYKQPVDMGKNANGEDVFIRLGYITSKDLLHKGTAIFLKLNYPDIFEKLSSFYPEIKNKT